MNHHVRAIIKSPGALLSGVILGFLCVLFIAPLLGVVDDLYNRARPIITDWKVDKAVVEGEDVTLMGTMIKHRDCLFIPPTIATDETGQNHAVVSMSPTSGMTWGARDAPQRWGPWLIRGAAGRRLEFANVYICANGRPNVSRLGHYIPGRLVP